MNGDLIIERQGAYSGTIETGLALANRPIQKGGWRELIEAGDDIGDDMMKAHTALLLENTKVWLGSKLGVYADQLGKSIISEATLSANVSGLTTFLFPVVRASFPNNPIHDLFSVQPLVKETGTIFYWEWTYGTSKGSIHEGQKMADATRGTPDSHFHYSDGVVDEEHIGDGDNSSTPGPFTLKFHSGGGIIPGSVKLTVPMADGSTLVAHDDGNGSWLGAVTGTVNYRTGVINPDVQANTANGQPIVAFYRQDTEGSPDIPKVSVQVTSSTVKAMRRALQLEFSVESVQNVTSELGISLHDELVTGASEQINRETARQLLYEAWTAAPLVASFPVRPASAARYTQQDHFRDLVYILNTASSHIENQTQKGYGNWVVVDSAAATLIESMPSTMFEAAPRPDNVQGLHYIGRLQNRYSVFKDLFLDKLPNASASGNILMGYKGSAFHEAGLVYAPWHLLYTTAPITLASFLTQQGIASRYATKMVNPAMYARIELTPGATS